jgi:hypothetical protein
MTLIDEFRKYLRKHPNIVEDRFSSDWEYLTDNTEGRFQIPAKPINIKDITTKINLENCYSLGRATVRHSASGLTFEIVAFRPSSDEVYVEIDHGQVPLKCEMRVYGPDGPQAQMSNYGTYHKTEGAIYNLQNNTLEKIGFTVDFGDVSKLNDSVDWFIQGLITSGADGKELEKAVLLRFEAITERSADLSGLKIVRNNLGGWDAKRLIHIEPAKKLKLGEKPESPHDEWRALPIGQIVRTFAMYMDPSYKFDDDDPE